MNVRERFLTVMDGGRAAPPKWEFGYWGANYANWYREGLPKHRQPRLDDVHASAGNSPRCSSWAESRSRRSSSAPPE